MRSAEKRSTVVERATEIEIDQRSREIEISREGIKCDREDIESERY